MGIHVPGSGQQALRSWDGAAEGKKSSEHTLRSWHPRESHPLLQDSFSKEGSRRFCKETKCRLAQPRLSISEESRTQALDADDDKPNTYLLSLTRVHQPPSLQNTCRCQADLGHGEDQWLVLTRAHQPPRQSKVTCLEVEKALEIQDKDEYPSYLSSPPRNADLEADVHRVTLRSSTLSERNACCGAKRASQENMSCSGRLVNLAMSCKHPSNASLARARSRSAQAVIMAIGMASNSLVASSMQPQFANTTSIADHDTRLLSGMPSNRKSRDLNSRLSRTWRRGVGRQGEALEAAQPLVYGSQDFPGTAAATVLPLANMSGSLVPGSGQDPRLFQEQRRRLSGQLEMDPRNFADGMRREDF
ncbi:hypothetical protein SELMODRAFT_421031 [Selaginella moellendorffii]|uniref:Uncharacterized protein n=1 Tax=Selaginella moellendorffii TaxID=88036 RepID=D8SDX2_SELML|nr:hypothetical protein SELMODRAFT_421031 [Selaginella moellendorffii]